jgi:hypothetical protein
MLHFVRVPVVLLAVLLLSACSLSTQLQLTPLAPQPVSPRSPLSTPGESPLPMPGYSPLPTLPAGERGSAPIPAEAEAAVRAAVNDLAAKLKIPSDAVQVASVSAVDWSDTSLGCPQPGMFYAQVIVQGYKITLSAGGQQVEYHADQRGRIVTCSK